jgi:hypothetical protein
MSKLTIYTRKKAVARLLSFSLICAAIVGAETLTNERITELAQHGVTQEELARIIRTAPEISFYLTPTGIDALLKAGVSDETIKAMAARENGSTVSAPNTAIPISGAMKVSSLAQVHKIYVEKMPNDFEQFLCAEFSKQMRNSITVVLNTDQADAVLTGTAHDRWLESVPAGAPLKGRNTGLHDNSDAAICLINSAGTAVLWSNEAGDRSLLFSRLHRNGERKAAARLVRDLKHAMHS